MDVPRNLISDSVLIQETFELVRANGGRIAASQIADTVFCLAHADASLSALLVSDLLCDDPRFQIADGYVEVVHDETEQRPLRETEFVVLDLEATTLPPQPPRIIELAAYRVRANTILGEFQTLLNPGIPVAGFVASLTGITNQMLLKAPVFADVANDWLRFAGDAVLVAHNATFDLPLLNREIARVFPGHRMRNSDLCTVQLSRRIIPDLEGHKLDSLAEHFGIEISQRHRAAGDARATVEVLIRLLAKLEEHGIRTLAEARTFRINGKPHPAQPATFS